MKLVIDRKRWLRGEGSEGSMLLRSIDDKMCCLGFYGIACGLTPERIRDAETPSDVPVQSFKKSIDSIWGNGDWLFKNYTSSADCEALMGANDDEHSSDQAREDRIKEVFAKHDVEVEFI